MAIPTIDPVELLRISLDSYKEEYRDLMDTWKSLDSKAQGCGGLAGIFLAAGFAWARQMTTTIPSTERFALAVSLIVLVGSVLCAVLALQIRTVPAPPLGDATGALVRDLLKARKPKEAPARLAAFHHDQIGLWKKVNEQVDAKNASKARWTLYSQAALLCASVIVAMISVLSMFSR